MKSLKSKILIKELNNIFVDISFDKNRKSVYNKNRKCEPRKWLPSKRYKPFTRSKAEWFIFYCLCSKIQMMINKATFMIAIPTNPKKSRYVILNNADSTILTTSIYQSHN